MQKVSPKQLLGPTQSAVWACSDMPGLIFGRSRRANCWMLSALHPFGRGFPGLQSKTTEKVFRQLKDQQFRSRSEAISATRLAWEIEA